MHGAMLSRNVNMRFETRGEFLMLLRLFADGTWKRYRILIVWLR